MVLSNQRKQSKSSELERSVFHVGQEANIGLLYRNVDTTFYKDERTTILKWPHQKFKRNISKCDHWPYILIDKNHKYAQNGFYHRDVQVRWAILTLFLDILIWRSLLGSSVVCDFQWNIPSISDSIPVFTTSSILAGSFLTLCSLQ